MKEFKPTFLYIKQHNVTGLKYFGKTVNKNPYKYKGSGKVWTRHINKHGNNVTTVWVQLFTNKGKLVKYATTFSKDNNIVESTAWANLKQEDGLWGGGVKGIKIKRTAEHNKKIADAIRKPLLEKNGFIKRDQPKVKKGRSKGGWKWSDEDRAKLSAQRMGRTPWNKKSKVSDL
jgi:hypothetical protein